MEYYDVFVYGTLRKGGIYHEMLKNAEVIRENYVLPGYCLYDFQQWYPFMVKGLEKDQVVGEIYRVDQPLLEKLHQLEDIEDELYRFAYLPDHQCYIYEKFDLDVKGLDPIPTGDWIEYKASLEN